MLPLPIWVVYDHPRDQPDWFIVRRQFAHQDGTITYDRRAYGFRDLVNARGWLAQQGLICLARHADDDPVIVEAWI
jgi:hypothetical protein